MPDGRGPGPALLRGSGSANGSGSELADRSLQTGQGETDRREERPWGRHQRRLRRTRKTAMCARSSPNRLQRRWAILKGGNNATRTQRDALMAYAVPVASSGLHYLSQIVLARWMGRFEYGIQVFVWTSVLMLRGLAHLGLNLVMIRLIPECRATGKTMLLRGGRLVAFGATAL